VVFHFPAGAAMLRSLAGEGPDWIPDRFPTPSHVNYFSFFPVVFTSSKRFALHNVALASLPRASGLWASISLGHRLFIFLSGTKALLLKEKVGVSGGGVRPLAAETSNWRS